MTPYYDHAGIQIFLGDCLEVLPELGPVDAVVTDPPYGMTDCRWDSVVDINVLWSLIWAIANEGAAVVMTACFPFAATLVSSQLDAFRHDWVWVKPKGSNFFNLKHAPMREHESVLVFSKGGGAKYYPVKEKRRGRGPEKIGKAVNRLARTSENRTMVAQARDKPRPALRYPSSVRYVTNETGLHSTQKPTALMAYLVQTYSQPGETVLDPFMGSGTTLRAAKDLGRKAIGVEVEERYCEVAAKRLSQEVLAL